VSLHQNRTSEAIPQQTKRLQNISTGGCYPSAFLSVGQKRRFFFDRNQGNSQRSWRGKSPCPLVRKIIEKHIEENRRKIKELQKLKKKMEAALNTWKEMENSLPNGGSVCHLIESVAEVKKSLV
jgi:hypothetical protein